jgi:hypothetical protein
MAVHQISSFVLPWMGGPSLSFAGPHAELPDAVEHDRLDEHEDGHGGDDQHVPQAVDLLGLARRLDGEPVDQQAEGDAQDGHDHADRQHLAQLGAALARPLGLLRRHQFLSSEPMGRASYGTRATDGMPGAEWAPDRYPEG